ncbi:tetratricopeptide (TPR) repeat protein [Kibdelosporangium banguiense]|uniref:Tetratricopeptide (TPR) repeat protein n=1 Tax=Kibdelosporangium banguiense TaxID=1365924 RepID=A0ABS4TVH6_9PSEU|nr:AAA family ATPase [Kibdelosporangium banguiense]MBP2328363.1 tetratricopeptide (TPR) repeat protein [Kibdelosporangium banguiense]
MSTSLAVRLFGAFEVVADGTPVVLPRQRKACELLAWLAVHPGQHARSRLAARFWPDVLDASARASLRSAIWTLRGALGPAQAWLQADRERVELRADGLTVDLRVFDELVAAGKLAEAERLRRGDVLHLFDSDWAFELRAEYDDKFAALLDKLAQDGDPDYAHRARRLRVRFDMPPDAVPAVPEHDLVGRGKEIAVIRRCWDAARAGAGTVVAITGDGGIGKTRLAEEVLAIAGADGARAAGGAGPTVPFGVWLEALRALADDPLPDAWWPQALSGLLPAAAPGRVAPGHHLDRVRVFEAVVSLLAWACRSGPVAIVLEDLHLADSSSLELLAYAGRRATRLPILLVVTRRRLPPRPDVDRVCATLRASGALGVEVDLAPLPRESVQSLAHATAPLSAGQAEEVVAVASGSPLLAVELARALAGGADAAEGLRSATRWATGRLHGPARVFVELAAVAGRDLQRAEVAVLPGLADPVQAAAEALGSGLLRERDGTIGFRHALLADAVAADLPDPLRSRRHGTIAAALRRAPMDAPRRAAEIARHLRLAGHDEQAVTHLVKAAASARSVCALVEAADLLTEVAEIDPHDPDTFVELAEVEAWRGLLGESDAAFDQALELIAPLDRGALVSAWLRRGRWLRGGLCIPRECRRSYASALDVLDRDPDADPPARIEALAGMAWAEAVTGSAAAAEELLVAVDALTDRKPLGDLLTHDVSVARAHILLRTSRFADSYAPLIAAAAAANRAGRPDLAFPSLLNAASAAACLGAFDRALDFIDRSMPLAAPNGLLRLGVYAHSARVSVLCRLGRVGEAAASCDQGAVLAERLSLSDLVGLVHHDRATIARTTGDWERAADELAAAIEMNAPVGRALTRLYRADALARAGRPADAEAELRAVTQEPVSPADFPDTLVARMSAVQGLIAARRADPELARRRLSEAIRGWQHRAAYTGQGYVAALIDLGRPPLTALVEPDRELAAVTADLRSIDADVR